jgi:hypothetical protein
MICGERAAKGLEIWALGLAETEEAEAGLKDDAAPTVMQYPKMLVGLRLFAFCSAPSFSSSLFFSLLRNCPNEIREALDGGEVELFGTTNSNSAGVGELEMVPRTDVQGGRCSQCNHRNKLESEGGVQVKNEDRVDESVELAWRENTSHCQKTVCGELNSRGCPCHISL